ncbi:MAG: MFS transporter [Mycobacteriaceae bacterium]
MSAEVTQTPDVQIPDTQTPDAQIFHVQRRTVRVLAASQVLGGVGVATGVAVSSLVAARLSGSDTIAGLAQTSAVVGAGLVALPMARIAARSGRRPSLATGYVLAGAGALVCVVATATQLWPLLLLGLVFFGGGSAAGLASRYAATDLAQPTRRGRDLSTVVWATTVGSVLGPNLAGPSARLGLGQDAGPYVISTVAFGLAALLVLLALRPDPLSLVEQAPTGAARSLRRGWSVLVAAPTARLALAAIVVSHVVMVGLMSMTPVHMGHGGATLKVIGLVITAHIAGMYALSPVVGWLADRLGRIPVLVLGAGLLGASAVVLAGTGAGNAEQLTVGLVLLGLGWSCGLVAGSALLIDSVPAADRTAVQGLSDLAMNVGGAAGGVVAGAVVASESYAVLATGAAVLVGAYLMVVLFGGWRNQRLRFV